MLEAVFQELALTYQLGTFCEYKQISGGWTHVTFLVTFSSGKYVIQQVNPLYPESKHSDYVLIYQHIKQLQHKNLILPKLLSNKNGNLFSIRNKDRWIVYEYIENDRNTLKTDGTIMQCAITHREFNTLLQTFPSEKLSFLYEHHHNYRHYKEELSKVAPAINHLNFETSSLNIALLLENIELHQRYIPDLPYQLLHGDPKFENFLFKDGKVISLLDLDILFFGNPILDMGDALRSWSRNDDFTFNSILFSAGTEGYLSRMKDGDITKEHLFHTMAFVTLLLILRHCICFYTGKYFSWNSTKYRSLKHQSMERAAQYLKYYESMSNIEY